MRTHNVYSYGEIRKQNINKFSPLTSPLNNILFACRHDSSNRLIEEDVHNSTSGKTLNLLPMSKFY